MNKIFISYRRADSEDVSGRIYDHLVSCYGKINVFKDVDSIPRGVDYRDHIKMCIGQSRVMLIIIGPNWASLRDESDHVRLENQEDFVRLEIEIALSTPNMVIIPVLVRRTAMPKLEFFPNTIQKVFYLNASQVRPDPDFNNDIRVLTTELDKRILTSAGRLRRKMSVIMIAAIVFIGLAFMLYFFNRKGAHPNDGKADTTDTQSPVETVAENNDPLPFKKQFDLYAIGSRISISSSKIDTAIYLGTQYKNRVVRLRFAGKFSYFDPVFSEPDVRFQPKIVINDIDQHEGLITLNEGNNDRYDYQIPLKDYSATISDDGLLKIEISAQDIYGIKNNRKFNLNVAFTTINMFDMKVYVEYP